MKNPALSAAVPVVAGAGAAGNDWVAEEEVASVFEEVEPGWDCPYAATAKSTGASNQKLADRPDRSDESEEEF